jgi:hypothetical protein
MIWSHNVCGGDTGRPASRPPALCTAPARGATSPLTVTPPLFRFSSAGSRTYVAAAQGTRGPEGNLKHCHWLFPDARGSDWGQAPNSPYVRLTTRAPTILHPRAHGGPSMQILAPVNLMWKACR